VIRRPAKRVGTVALVGGLLLFAGATAQSGWLFVLAAGVFGTVAGSALVRPRLDRVEIERSHPPRLQVGDHAPVTVAIANRGAALPALRVEDACEAFEPAALACPALLRGERAVVETTRTARLRGVHVGGQVQLSTTAPLGFVRSRCPHQVPGAITVVPRAVDLPRLTALEETRAARHGAEGGARAGQGLDYIGVRDYRPGDAFRAVHWRSVARTGRLIVREFEDEARTAIALVLAGEDAGEPPDSAFEALVTAAASIARAASSREHRVDLIRPGAHLRDAGSGGGLEWLAAATPADAPLTPLVDRAVGATGRGGSIVLLTPTTGRTAGDVPTAVRRARNASCRVLVVRALSSSWGGGGDEVATDPGAPLRTIVRGRDLAACLSS
jgi:uncharacterized protein (DUF58 family)